MKKVISLLTVFILLFTLFSCKLPNIIVQQTETEKNPETVSLQDNSTFEVYFIDVGQADCTLICCDGHYMLVDAGNVDDSSLVYSFLNKHGVKKLDIVVGTHAHEDHMGGIAAPLNTIETKVVYVPKTQSESKFYQNFLNAVNKNSINVLNPKPGDKAMLGCAEITFLAPVTEDKDDINNTSVVFRIVYGNTSFMFTGDAERESEQEILKLGYDLKSDVLKVGHHGSSSSTSYVFLNEVLPQYAVISCGKDNSYGHPHEEIVSRLNDADAIILRTDILGDIKMVSDGKTVSVVNDIPKPQSTQSGLQTEEYTCIGNKNSHIFHTCQCSSLPAESNRVYFTDRQSALDEGYTPCKNCNP